MTKLRGRSWHNKSEMFPRRSAKRAGFTLIEMLIVIIIIAILMALLIPTAMQIMCAAREAAAKSIIKDIGTALKNYDTDFGTYPPTGSKNMVDYLSKEGARKLRYYNFMTDQKTSDGKLRSPVSEDDIIEYVFPGVNNTKGFDLYCKDCEGKDKAINNWE